MLRDKTITSCYWKPTIYIILFCVHYPNIIDPVVNMVLKSLFATWLLSGIFISPSNKPSDHKFCMNTILFSSFIPSPSPPSRQFSLSGNICYLAKKAHDPGFTIWLDNIVWHHYDLATKPCLVIRPYLASIHYLTRKLYLTSIHDLARKPYQNQTNHLSVFNLARKSSIHDLATNHIWYQCTI